MRQRILMVASDRLTATWQLSVLPKCPQYCRATPTERLPYLRKPVSSIRLSAGQNLPCCGGWNRLRSNLPVNPLRSRPSPGEEVSKIEPKPDSARFGTSRGTCCATPAPRAQLAAVLIVLSLH